MKAEDQTKQSDRGRKILITGEVVSNKMAKTICVQVFRTVRHAKYGKFLKRSSIFKAHDENSSAGLGDIVEIRETRPLSKTKRFRLVRVLTKNTDPTIAATIATAAAGAASKAGAKKATVSKSAAKTAAKKLKAGKAKA